MRLPRPRRSRAKGRRKDRRDAISTRLGRLEPEQTTPPEKKAEEGEKKKDEGKEDEDDDSATLGMLRVALTRAQVHAFVVRAATLVSAGRPPCREIR